MFWRRPDPQEALLRKRVRMHFRPDTMFEQSIEGLLVDIVADEGGRAGHYMLAAAELVASGGHVVGIDNENESLNPIAIPAAAVLFWEVL